jgi:uncharacterized phiE125 gp8 family phage protein
MNLRLAIAPTSDPVSLAAAKSYLRVDGNEDDATIASLVKSACQKGEDLSRRAFVTQTWDMIINAWPLNFRLKLYRPPLQSVTSVKYVDITNVEHTWTDYVLDIGNEPGVIIFNSLPGAALRLSGAITVRFVAGFGVDTSVPEHIKSTILSLVAYWYENRERHDVPAEIKRAFMAERVVWF